MTAGAALLAPPRGALATVSSRATALSKATGYDAANDRYTDLSGHGHHFVSGSTVGADASDPVLVPWDATHGQCLYQPGSSGNYADVPDSPSLRFAGPFSIVAKVAPDLWAPSSTEVVVAKWQTNKQSYRLVLLATGALQGAVSTTGTDVVSQTSTQLLNGLAARTVRWVRWDFVPDDGAGKHSSTFYTATTVGPPTAPDWTQLGALVANVPAVTVFQSDAPVEIGSQLAGTSFVKPHRAWRVRLWDGPWNTTLAFDADFSTAAEPFATVTDAAHGATVTIRRAATGIKATIIDRSSILFGSTYLEAADHADWNLGHSTPATLVICYRRQLAVTATVAVVAKTNTIATTPDPGWLMLEQSTPSGTGRFTDGALSGSATSAGAVEVGVAHMYWMVRRPGTGQVVYGRDATALATATDLSTGAIGNTFPVRVGRLSGATGSHSEPVVFAWGWWREALSLADLARLQSELLVAAA